MSEVPSPPTGGSAAMLSLSWNAPSQHSSAKSKSRFQMPSRQKAVPSNTGSKRHLSTGSLAISRHCARRYTPTKRETVSGSCRLDGTA